MVISKQDGKTKSVIMNQKDKDGMMMNQLDKGDFDVEIDTGPSFSVQKDIALEFLQQTLQAFPQSFPLIADLWAKNLDVQFMPQIAERFQSMVPPEILAKENGQPPPPPKPDPQAMMMQQEMQMKQHQMQIEEQKMQIEMQQVRDRAAELQIRQEKHELEKAELFMKAHELQDKMGMNSKKDQLESQKAEMGFTTHIAKLYADMHKNSQKST
jgi:hypothetical protein